MVRIAPPKTPLTPEVPTDASHRIRARRRYSARPRRDAERAEDVMRVYRIPADASLDLWGALGHPGPVGGM